MYYINLPEVQEGTLHWRRTYRSPYRQKSYILGPLILKLEMKSVSNNKSIGIEYTRDN